MKYLGTKTLETKRLLLRKVKEKDYKDAFKNWCNSDKVDKYVTWTKHINEEETKELYKKWIEEYDEKTYKWAIELKEINEVIGTITVSKKFIEFGTCEIGYCLSDKYWNQGIMTEAASEVVKFLFEECEADTIWAEFLENNPASGKVMEKIGMKYEGRLRSRIFDKTNKRNDLLVYSILKEEYFNNIKHKN